MNRQIKFRCWDEENKKMWPYAVPLLGRNKINASYQKNGGFNDFVNGVLLQFTGLHDVKNKEIFEGDIVALIARDGSLEGVTTVVFEMGCFKRLSKFAPNAPYIEDAWGRLSVIGNIYQNPELLNGGSDV